MARRNCLERICIGNCGWARRDVTVDSAASATGLGIMAMISCPSYEVAEKCAFAPHTL